MGKEVIKILDKLNFTNFTYKKVSLSNKNTWVVDLKKRKLILKIKNKNNKLKSKKHFHNELTIYHFLNKKSFKNIPKIISTDNITYILLEFISSDKLRNLNHRNQFIDLLLEFNCMNASELKKNNRINEILYAWKITLFSLFKGNRLYDGFKTLGLFVKLNLGIKNENRNYLIHNDLYGYNNLLLDKNRIVIIDFETTICTSRWRFKDIIELSINRENAIIDFDLINNYLSKTMSNIDVGSFYNQFRYVVIFRMLKNLYRTKDKKTLENKYKWKDLYYKMLSKKTFNQIKTNFIINTDHK